MKDIINLSMSKRCTT